MRTTQCNCKTKCVWTSEERMVQNSAQKPEKNFAVKRHGEAKTNDLPNIDFLHDFHIF